MKNTFKALSLIFLGTVIMTSCEPKKAGTDVMDTEANDSVQMDSITVTPVADSKQFPGAELKIASITSEKAGADSAKITVKYTINNFTLTDQTEHEHHMANSTEGQHIHFILDNTPYAALYKPEHSVTVPVNSEHYLMSFLSRSFHESIKTPEASKLVKFKIDADGKFAKLPEVTEPSLFYSRPKGEYKGADTQTILLDFFVSNTTLAADGNKVKADINGQEFTLDSWQPYEIKGLPMGESTIKLTLMDKDGKEMTGDNVSVERKITLTE